MRCSRQSLAGLVAVIFMSKRNDTDGYDEAVAEMRAAAGRFPGYVGLWSARGEDGVGITVSYWASNDAARAWKADANHAAVREQGRARWYDWYEMAIADVTRVYGWQKPGSQA